MKNLLHYVPDASPFQGTNYVCHKCSYAYYAHSRKDKIVSNIDHFTKENAETNNLELCNGSNMEERMKSKQ